MKNYEFKSTAQVAYSKFKQNICFNGDNKLNPVSTEHPHNE